MIKEMRHHWIGIKPNPKKYYGFIYEIHNTIEDKYYIGCKQFYRYKKGTYKILSEQKWQTYTGSNDKLNADIKRLGKKNFTFNILKHTPNRGMHKYLETDMIVRRGAILPKNKDKYYNGQCSGIKFPLSDEIRNGVKK